MGEVVPLEVAVGVLGADGEEVVAPGGRGEWEGREAVAEHADFVAFGEFFALEEEVFGGADVCDCGVGEVGAQ